MKKIILYLICIFSLNSHSKEIISSFKISSSNKNLKKIANRFEIKHKLKDQYLIYVLEDKVDEFKQLAPNAELLQKDINKNIRDKELSGYHTFSEVQKKI